MVDLKKEKTAVALKAVEAGVQPRLAEKLVQPSSGEGAWQISSETDEL